MLRTTLAAALLAGTVAIGAPAMAGTGAPSGQLSHIRGAVMVVADNEAPAAAPAAKDPLSTDQVEKFREEVRNGNHKSASAKIDLKVGSVLPADIAYYALTPQWNMTQYKYALVNNKTVLIDEKTRKVVQILDTDTDMTKAKKGTAEH